MLKCLSVYPASAACQAIIKNADAKLSGENLVKSFAGSQGSFKLYCVAAFPHFVIHILALLQLAQVQNSVARWRLCH